MRIKVEKMDGKRIGNPDYWIAEIYGTDEIWEYKRYFLDRIKIDDEEYYDLIACKYYDIKILDKRGFYYCDGDLLTEVNEEEVKKKAKWMDKNAPEYQKEIDKIKEEKEEKYQQKVKKRNKEKRRKLAIKRKFMKHCKKFKRYAFINNFLASKY